MPASREVERRERLGHLVGRHSIKQEQRVNILQQCAHRGDIRHVSLDRLDGRRDLNLGCAAANECAYLCVLPSELLHDLRSDVAGAARDENRHGSAPCCKSKPWRMMWGVGAVWKRGRTAK